MSNRPERKVWQKLLTQVVGSAVSSIVLGALATFTIWLVGAGPLPLVAITLAIAMGLGSVSVLGTFGLALGTSTSPTHDLAHLIINIADGELKWNDKRPDGMSKRNFREMQKTHRAQIITSAIMIVVSLLFQSIGAWLVVWITGPLSVAVVPGATVIGAIAPVVIVTILFATFYYHLTSLQYIHSKDGLAAVLVYGASQAAFTVFSYVIFRGTGNLGTDFAVNVAGAAFPTESWVPYITHLIGTGLYLALYFLIFRYDYSAASLAEKEREGTAGTADAQAEAPDDTELTSLVVPANDGVDKTSANANMAGW